MKNGLLRSIFLLTILSNSIQAFAQNSGPNSNTFSVILIGIVALLILGVVALVGENLLGIEAKRRGVDDKMNTGIFPSWNEMFAPKVPAHVANQKVKVLTKGFSIDLIGDADNMVQVVNAKSFALQPQNFRGIAPIPKVEIEIGANVKAGDVVFYDKNQPQIKYVAPVSGEYIALNRSAKRAVSELVFIADKTQSYKKFNVPNLETSSRDEIKNFLMESGAWTLLRQRPFDIVAEVDANPKNIFISGFDSAPLAPNLNLAVADRGNDLNAGLEVLSKLTDGKVYLGLDANDTNIASELVNAENCEKTYFMGKHPAGNVGIQIHHTAPINSGDIVWTMSLQDVLILGNLFLEGVWDTTKIVAITGSEIDNPTHIKTKMGANIGELIGNRLKNENSRILSGDVLTGKIKSKSGFLNTYDDQITTILEGDYYEMFGWLLPQKSRPSASATYPNGFFPNTKYLADTNLHGEQRAFVMTGQYEEVLPMDVYPQHLMKAILANDFEKMEGLGIYELIEEDVALCEFVCTSKQPLQKILRDGLDYVKEQA